MGLAAILSGASVRPRPTHTGIGETIIKRIAIIAAAGFIAAAVTSPALAGRTNEPGQGGQAVSEGTQAAKEAGTSWGQFVSDFVHASDENLGPLKKEAFPDGRPNPASDNGKGND